MVQVSESDRYLLQGIKQVSWMSFVQFTMSVLLHVRSIFWKYTIIDYINRYMFVTVELKKILLSGGKASPFLVRDDLPVLLLKQ